MATNNLQISNLDFDSIKNNFKQYLKSQDVFKDYNFDASSLSILLDILAYNTFYNGFYANMIGTEMFLDTATLRESVVSRSKSIGYKHASPKSSKVYVNLESHITKKDGVSAPETIVMNKYSTFLTEVQENEYTFTNIDDIVLTHFVTEDTDDYWCYKATNVKLNEGNVYTYSWKVQGEYEKYILPNTGIDLDTLLVRVFDDQSSTNYTIFTLADNILEIDENSNVFWTTEVSDEKFALEFGNGTIGKALNIGNVINVVYLKCNGINANGAKTFVSGNIAYSDVTLSEQETLIVTPANITTLYLSGVNGTYTANSFVRGETSNSTGYIDSFDFDNNILKIKYPTGSFIALEKLHEEAIVANNTIFGANSTINSIKNDVSSSFGGANIESIESIKFNAPKFFGAQNRLVTESDFEAILKRDYPFVDSVVAWDNAENELFPTGNIYVSVKPQAREELETWEKNYILTNIINPKKIIGTTINFVDPEYIYIDLDVITKYDSDAASFSTEGTIKTNIDSAISDFFDKNFSKFKNTFFYSQLSGKIDNSNDYILGTDLNITLTRKVDLSTSLNSNSSFSLNFSNSIDSSVSTRNLKSSMFSCNVSGTVYPNCFLTISTNNTRLNVSNSSGVVVENIGSIDYTNGIVSLTNINISDSELYDSYNNPYMEITVKPKYKDLVSSENQILKLNENIQITTVAVKTKK